MLPVGRGGVRDGHPTAEGRQVLRQADTAGCSKRVYSRLCSCRAGSWCTCQLLLWLIAYSSSAAESRMVGV